MATAMNPIYVNVTKAIDTISTSLPGIFAYQFATWTAKTRVVSTGLVLRQACVNVLKILN